MFVQSVSHGPVHKINPTTYLRISNQIELCTLFQWLCIYTHNVRTSYIRTYIQSCVSNYDIMILEFKAQMPALK